MPPKAPPLTDEQTEAVARYALAHETSWRTALFAEWCRGTASPILHALRRTHGLAWLMTYTPDPGAIGSVSPAPYTKPDYCPYCDSVMAVQHNYPSGNAEYFCAPCDYRWGRTAAGALLDLRSPTIAAE